MALKMSVFLPTLSIGLSGHFKDFIGRLPARVSGQFCPYFCRNALQQLESACPPIRAAGIALPPAGKISAVYNTFKSGID